VAIISTVHDPTQADTTLMYVGLSDGTSMASPHVAGVAALLESYNSALSAPDKINLMVSHTKAFAASNTKALGPGILDANLALLASPSPLGVADSPKTANRLLELRAAPNPVRGGTDLVVRAQAQQPVVLRILDAAGRQVHATRGVADASGMFRVRWDARSEGGVRASTGLYFVHVSTPSEKATQKLVVLE
jgi:hypothetical protein